MTYCNIFSSLDNVFFNFGLGYVHQGIAPTEDIPDSMLLQVARRISKEKFYEIGNQLGFDRTELEHIEHRSLYNRKDANIQMLYIWKASQTSKDKGKEKLRMVWKSVSETSKATCMNGILYFFFRKCTYRHFHFLFVSPTRGEGEN
ncbi:uncharacterized protein LOC121416639 [Lytechinus variegatus]|uniref:uncharacterized protein LOC121416639 n=1 Tax=Lytechinus variegatus TaxID=7654 RepID=UPI001BB0DAF1|nr:uncharacterized protein LOC121416639 [Lytechinus variegatus]